MGRRRLAGVVGVGAALVLGAVLVRQGPAPFGSHTLAFACAGRICVWDGERDTQRVVADVPGGYATNPVWSPDGERLAFTHTQDGPRDPSVSPRRDLYVVDADGSNRIRLAAGVANTTYGLPLAWSPDATRLAVTLDPPGSVRPNADGYLVGPQGDLYVIDVVGGARRRLTRRSAMFNGYPGWVNRRLVVYVRAKPRRELERSNPSEIRIVDSLSGRDRFVLRGPGGIQDLVVSPDRRRAAVVLNDSERTLLVDLDSGRQTTVTHRPGMTDAVWSPDGRLLALNGDAIIDLTTSRLRSDGSPPGCGDPDWSPDGRWLVCTTGYGEEDEKRRGGYDLNLVRATTGRRTSLTDSASARDARWRPLSKRARSR